MDDLIKRAAKDISESKSMVALTGAGISVESGIPPFRGKGGVWEKIDPDYASIEKFMRDPADVWKVLIKEMKELIDRAEPNDGHKGLARLEKMGLLKAIITQNVDGLHQMAGNSDVIEFHGSFAWQRCMICNKRCDTKEIDLSEIPPRCHCGGIYRPEVIFFGEMIPPHALNRSKQLAAQCDVMLVVGTSATVHPAAYMPVIAKQSGAKVIEMNMERTHLTSETSDYLLKGGAGEIMNDLFSEIERQKS
ncbi:MAG: RNA polymerase subunit sigma [Desulfobacteraceae bacterium 4572_88]|nr:MAG: RNA polymerase subunit sigma [Desulfobacteraceae bacterium 4572_88]